MAYDYRKDYIAYQREQKKKNAKHSVCLFFAFLLGFVYLVFLLYITYVNTTLSATIEESVGAAIGLVIGQALIWPHMVSTLLAVIFSGFAFARKSRAFAMTGAVFYTLALVFHPEYFMFVILEALLCFIGFIRTP